MTLTTWRKTDLLFQTRQKFGEFGSEHTKVSKTCTLVGPFCAKYITFELKKYRYVIFHETEASYKIWRKTDLWFGKWHEKFSKFSQNTWKCQNLGFDGILKKLQRSYLQWHWKMMNNLKTNWLVVSKLTWGI